MDNGNRPKKSAPTWLIILGGFIGFAVISPLVRHVVQNTFQADYQSGAATTPENARKQLDQISQTDPLFGAIRANFPQDYERIMVSASALVADDRITNTDAAARAFALIQEFTNSKLIAVSRSSPLHLQRFIDGEYQAIKYLEGSNVSLCAQFGMRGLDSSTVVPEEFSRLGSRAGKNLVEAARNGTDQPTEYAEVTESDMLSLEAQMKAVPGGTRTAALALSGRLAEATELDQCTASVALYRALSTMEPARAAPLISRVLRDKAKAKTGG